MSGVSTTRDALPAPGRGVAEGFSRRAARRLGVAGLGLLLAAGGAWYGRNWWTEGRFIQSTDDAYVGGNVTPIAPHVAGFVERILVADNQRVTAGKLLVQLDRRDVAAALGHAQAALAAREAALDGLRAQYAQQRSAVREHEADLSARVAQASFADQDAARYRILASTAAGSRQDAQRTLSLDQAARATVNAAGAALEAARQELDVLQAQTAEASAAVAQARADLRTAQLDDGYTQIRTPIDGYVGNRAAETGSYVSQGTYLLSIIPARGLWVDANFKEDQLARMVPGQPATVVADVLPGHVFHGRVASLAPGTGAVFSVIPPENATGNFTKIVQRVPVRVALDDADPALAMLRPGLSTTVGVDTRADRDAAP